MLATDGAALSQAMANPALDARATDFCMTAESSIGLYLSDLAVGTR